VLAYSPVILLVKDPVPVPSDVFVESEIVGLVVVAQTTPLAVMELPPSAVMFPPLVAVEGVIDVADTVADMVAKDPADVVKLISVP
jgi:hypothetical protein